MAETLSTKFAGVPVTPSMKERLVKFYNDGKYASYAAAARALFELGLKAGSTPAPTPTPTPTPAPTPTPTTTPITLFPPQPAGIIYGSQSYLTADWNRPGALAVIDQGNIGTQRIKDFSAAGGTALVYFDAVISNGSGGIGKYHNLLFNSSTYGPAVPNWPNVSKASDWGYLSDFRPGSVLLTKLESVLELIVSENPHIGGFFADDLGSRSWFPFISWGTFPDKAGYRNGAIEVAKVFRKVCDRHKLVFIVNGTWEGGDPNVSGGGYPTVTTHGLSLADGGMIEGHALNDFWKAYCGGQWGTAAISKKSAMFVVVGTDAERIAWVNSGVAAFIAQTSNYSGPQPLWASLHATGLPNKAS